MHILLRSQLTSCTPPAAEACSWEHLEFKIRIVGGSGVWCKMCGVRCVV